MKSRFKAAKNVLLFWCLFIGVGALWGGACMLISPDGSLLHMQGMLPFFKPLPFSDVLFSDYTFSGIALLVVNGFTNITAAVLIIMNKKSGIISGGVFGVTLMAWITIQFVIFPSNFLSTSFFIFGVAQALTGHAAYAFYMQEHFSADIADYPDIGKNPRQLVVFFSRLGYTKRAAFEAAQESGAEIFEIKTSEKINGTAGFLWCGRFTMHRWPMKLSVSLPDLSRYERVTVCTPVWAFSISSPVRAFCNEAAGKINSADYIIVHSLCRSLSFVADEMDSLLKIRGDSVTDICVKMGREKSRKTVKRHGEN